jgi:hypothetical protein
VAQVKAVTSLYNGPLETGVRATVILNALYPRPCDLAQLVWLDHLVVHTNDIGGPPSLHPDIPQRTGELLVRRQLVEHGLRLARQLHLVDMVGSSKGLLYVAGSEASPFVDAMQTHYGQTLRDRASWLATKVNQLSDAQLRLLIEQKIGRWAVEFQEGGTPI